jgi:hypothetical protein
MPEARMMLMVFFLSQASVHGSGIVFVDGGKEIGQGQIHRRISGPQGAPCGPSPHCCNPSLHVS